ncbi:M20 family metallopeptidase [Vibrio kyushuensis]|uniref:M20 metallopeptidase family protein n=1 Tax=Vibrio kyushuensis TaxID=2910249 RepID=UPI003D1334DD
MTLNNFELNESMLALKKFSITTRRELHKIPELSGEEVKTSKMCREILHAAGYSITGFDSCTGFYADLIVDPAFTTIAWRCDMDALEMVDLTNNQYSSNHDGRAHNCGHDTHMAISLTAAMYLSENKSEMKHNIRFIFQMAEEDMRVPGANKMVELGCMNGVSEVYALHNDAALECGTVNVNVGIMSSFGYAWTLNIKGVSAHGSTPHKGLDAIREGARIVADMDYIIAKQTSPFCPAVFVCGMFNGGTIPNAVAANVQARGTIRSMDEETNTILQSSFRSLSEQSEIRGYETSIDYIGYPAVINHPDAYKRVVQAASETVPSELLNIDAGPMTGSEDFSLMVNACEGKVGAMFFLGSGNKEKGINNYLHSNPYFVDEDCLIIGAQIVVNLVSH